MFFKLFKYLSDEQNWHKMNGVLINFIIKPTPKNI